MPTAPNVGTPGDDGEKANLGLTAFNNLRKYSRGLETFSCSGVKIRWELLCGVQPWWNRDMQASSPPCSQHALHKDLTDRYPLCQVATCFVSYQVQSLCLSLSVNTGSLLSFTSEENHQEDASGSNTHWSEQHLVSSFIHQRLLIKGRSIHVHFFLV